MSSDDGKTQQQTVQAVASKSVWTAYSDVYFEGEFEPPFSDSEEEVSTGSSGSGSSEEPGPSTPRRTVASQESSPEGPLCKPGGSRRQSGSSHTDRYVVVVVV